MDEDNNEQGEVRKECAINGIGFSTPYRDQRVKMEGVEGEDPLDPTEANLHAEPESRLDVFSLRDGNTKLGNRGATYGRVYLDTDSENNYAKVLLPGLPPIGFQTEHELRNFLRDIGMAMTHEKHDVKADQYVSGFENAQSFRDASPAMRQLAVGLTRIFGNNVFAAQALKAYRTSETAAFIDELTDRFERWADLSPEEKNEAIAALPDPIYDKTIAGRLLNAVKRVNPSFFNSSSVIYEALKRYGSSAAASEMGYIEQLRNKAKYAGIANPASPAARLYNSFLSKINSKEAKRLGISKDMISKYMLMKGHNARVENVEKNKKLAWKNSEGDIRVLAQYNTYNPTGFKFVTGEGKALYGIPGMDAFKNSLSAEQTQWLEGMSQFMAAASAHTNNALFAAGMIDKKTFQYRTRKDMFWMPLQDLETKKNPINNAHAPIGRRTEAENPLANYFQWVDSMHRAVATNHLHQELDRLVKKYDLDDVFLRDRRVVNVKNGQENYWPKNSDEKGIFVYNINEKGEVETRHIGFTENFGGRMAKSYLAPSYPYGGNRVHDALITARGYMRFTSAMMTTGKLTWLPRAMAMNLGVVPIAMESAFRLRPSEAPKVIAPFMANLPRAMRGLFIKGDHIDKDWITFFRENAGGTPIDEKYSAVKADSEIKAGFTSLSDLLNPKTAVSATTSYAKKGIASYMHFQHSADTMTQAAAFRSYLEYKAGRKFTNIDDMRRFASAPENKELMMMALNGSRRVLPNFSHAGGETSIGWLREFFPFFNATLQTFPYARQLFNSRSGKIGGGLAIIAGYMMREMYGDETGDKTSSINGEDGSLYFGNSFSIPSDYIYHPLLKLGANLYHVSNGSMGMKDALFDKKDGVVHSLLETFSPVQPPTDDVGQSQTFLMNVTPPLMHLPILALSATDQYGNSITADHVTDANGNELLGAENWQYGTPSTDILSTTTARAIAALTGGLVDIAPGRFSAAFKTVMPILPDTIDAITGEKAARRGLDPSFGQRAMDALLPGFEGQLPDVFQGRDRLNNIVQEKLRGQIPAGIPMTRQNLLEYGDNIAIEAQNMVENIQKQSKEMTINGMTLSEINRMLPIAAQNGDMDMRDSLLLMKRQHQLRVNDLYLRAVEELGG